MEGQTIQAVRGNPPFVQGQFFAGCGMIGLEIILIDGIQMLEQKIKDFRIMGHGSLLRKVIIKQQRAMPSPAIVD